MIQLKKAIQLAEDHLAKDQSGRDLVLLHSHTLEFESGWVFFYQSRDYVETRDINRMITDNSPILIDRTDGSLHITGTDAPVEKYIRDYMKRKQG